MVGIHILKERIKEDTVIPSEAILFDNPTTGDSAFFLPSTGDIYTTTLHMSEDTYIPENLPLRCGRLSSC